MILNRLMSLIFRLLDIASGAMFVYCILTWIAPAAPLTDWLRRLLEPLVAPFRPLARKAVLRWGARVDLSYFFAMIAIQLVRWLIARLYWLF